MKQIKLVLIGIASVFAIIFVVFMVNILSDKKMDVSNERYDSFISTEDIVPETTTPESEIVVEESTYAEETSIRETISKPADRETVLAETEVPLLVDDIDLTGTELTLYDVNSIIYSFGTMFGLTEDQMHYKSIVDTGENYEITFTDHNDKEYTIICTHDRLLIKIIRPE